MSDSQIGFNSRIGFGVDVHRLVPDRDLILGACNIPFEKGLLGHSDADVLLHAITDAIIGALAWGDIGSWFPDTDPDYKNADSSLLLAQVWERAQREGRWQITNLDATIMLERPKLRPYIDQMRASVAKLLKTDISRVSIKATTCEKMGFIGREEGISAQAVVLLSSQSI